MKKLLVICAVLVAGCAATPAHVTPQPTGGSKADGFVRMSYGYPAYISGKTPEVKWEEANANAVKRCQAWGYSNASRFGGEQRICQSSNSYGCLSWVVHVDYQCTE